jgi:hypothetical protein
MTKKTIILLIICLIAADQSIKLIIANYFIDTKFDIIDSVLGFHPIFNDKYSYFNAILKMNLGLLPHVIVLIFMQLFLIFFYGYFKAVKQHATRLLNITFIVGQAALVCVFCGFFFWKNGILDYMFLYLFTCDLKDIYLNCFALFFLWYYYKNKKEIQSSDLKMTGYLKERWIDIAELSMKCLNVKQNI